jgi:hypothetical protein
MSDVVYVSKVRLERVSGPLRRAYLPGEAQPISFGLHSELASHYGIDMARVKEPHASTIDYLVASLGG